jgi:hypothetical protein
MLLSEGNYTNCEFVNAKGLYRKAPVIGES